MKHRCECCFQPCESPLRCSRSKFAHYKDREHQKQGWVAGYQAECAALIAVQPRVPTATIRLAARCLLRALKDKEAYADVESLHAHWDRTPQSRQTELAQMAVLVREYVRGAASAVPAVKADEAYPDVKSTALLLARLACNSHTLADDELRPYGIGIFPLGAMVNHSDT